MQHCDHLGVTVDEMAAAMRETGEARRGSGVASPVDAGRGDAPLARLVPSGCDDLPSPGEVDGVTPSGGPATPADGSDESVGVPRFNVVLRGYDRRQVDEHLSRLQRRFNVMRRGLDSAHSQAVPASPGMPGARSASPTRGPAPRRGQARRRRMPSSTACRPSSRPPRRRPARSGARPRPRRGPRRNARRRRVRPPVRPRRRSGRRSRSWSASATPYWRTSPGYAASSRRCGPVRSHGSPRPYSRPVPTLS